MNKSTYNPYPADSDLLKDPVFGAEAALVSYIHITGAEPTDALPHLLCDLMHLAARNDDSFEIALKEARHYYDETTLAPAQAGE